MLTGGWVGLTELCPAFCWPDERKILAERLTIHTMGSKDIDTLAFAAVYVAV